LINEPGVAIYWTLKQAKRKDTFKYTITSNLPRAQLCDF